jgi:F-type H+-transporting ATPase subunit alpha
VGKSVSRVGGKAQLPAYRTTTGNLKLAYSQFEELENYARFGTRLDEHTQRVIDHGQRIRSWLKQPELHPMSVPEQLVVLLALTSGYFDNILVEKIPEAEALLTQSSLALPAELLQRLTAQKPLSPDDQAALLACAKTVLAPFQEQPAAEND